MKIVTVFNNKGGVGKTTTTINLAYDIAKQGGKALVIDLDPQENTTWFFKKLNSRTTIYKVLQRGANIDNAIRKTNTDGLDIVPGSTATELINGIDENTLKNISESSKKVQEYDVVIIDCPPSTQISTINALIAADRIIIPVKPDRYSLVGLRLIKKQGGQKNGRIEFTRYH